MSRTLLPISEYLAVQRHDLIIELVRSGANLHRIDRIRRTPLPNVIWNTFEGDAESMTTVWLDILNHVGINVTTYLQEELRIRPSAFELNAHNRRMQADCIRARKMELSISQPGSLSLEITRWVDPASPTYLLFQEFDLCPDIVVRTALFCSKLQSLLDLWQSDHSTRLVNEGRKRIFEVLAEWKQDEGKQPESESASDEVLDCDWTLVPNYLDPTSKQMRATARIILEYPIRLCRCDAYGNYIDLWPFYGGTHTLCSSGNRLTNGCLGRSRSNKWCEMHSCRYNHARFARKEEKKALKRQMIQGNKPAKTVMPGSWVV